LTPQLTPITFLPFLLSLDRLKGVSDVTATEKSRYINFFFVIPRIQRGEKSEEWGKKTGKENGKERKGS
jgi:hypothetical protein